MTTDAFRLHARIVLRFYTSIGTTKKILNLSFLLFVFNFIFPRQIAAVRYNEYFAFKERLQNRGFIELVHYMDG